MLYTDFESNLRAKDPAVIEMNGFYYLYHSCWEDNKLRIGIARSENGDRFEKIGNIPLTQECEMNGIGAPAAIVINSTVHLFYQTYGNGKLDAICHAVSDDGINFAKDETNPVFAPREPYVEMPEWSCGRAIDADVCLFGDRLFLYFATRDKAFERQIVGAAWAKADAQFKRGDFALCPDFAVSPTLEWEKSCIEAPATIVNDGKLYMFYGGAYNCAPQQIGCAVSDDGIKFTRLFVDEPFLKNGNPGSWNASESGHPYVYRANDGRIWLYYQGSPDKGSTFYLSRKEIAFSDGKPVLF